GFPSSSHAEVDSAKAASSRQSNRSTRVGLITFLKSPSDGWLHGRKQGAWCRCVTPTQCRRDFHPGQPWCFLLYVGIKKPRDSQEPAAVDDRRLRLRVELVDLRFEVFDDVASF